MRRPLIAAFAATALCLGVLSATVAAPAAAAPPKRIVSGWLPYWMTTPAHPEGVQSAVANVDLITDVSPFWYSATARSGGGVQVKFNPNFTNAAASSSWAMSQLKAAGLTVLPSIADGSGKGRMAATLADPTLRAQHVADIVAVVTSNNYDGIDLDYETFAFSDGSASWAATQPNWTAFVNELSAALHAQGKLLAVTIPPPCNTARVCGPNGGYWVYNMTGIAPAADRIRIMAYDFHVQGIGAIAPMPWVRAIVQYSASVMDPARLQIGVPTYGRAWTRKSANGGDRTEGVCPARSSSAYTTLVARSNINASGIPALLASVGVPETDVQWSDADQENWVYYDKTLRWTDSSGAPQVCIAKRVLWFMGPQGVLARTQLVGEFGLSAAAYWTIGGENAAQWGLVRGYAQSLAPAGTDVALVGAPPSVSFGTPVTLSATVTSGGVPVTGVEAALQFRPAGKKKFENAASAPINPDGTVTFTVTPQRSGEWAVFVPGVDGRAEGVSAPSTTQVLSAVSSAPTQTRVARRGTLVVTARALPAIEGQVLALQIERPDGTWQNVETLKANGKGRGRLKAKAPGKKGRYTYRVVAVGKRAVLSGASAEFRIRVR